MAQTGTVVFSLKDIRGTQDRYLPHLNLVWANVFVSQTDLSFVMNACQTVLDDLSVSAIK